MYCPKNNLETLLQVTKPDGSSLDIVVQSIVSHMTLNSASPAAGVVSGKKMRKIGMISSQ